LSDTPKKNTNPDKAFILAAGFGKRLRPYTNDMPKPMLKVGDKPMIDSALDKLGKIGVKECVVNTHYKAKKIANHLKNKTNPLVKLSFEPEILDTGGGIKNAITHFTAPFFVLSGDSVWEDSPKQNSLNTLAKEWDEKKMDILILLQPVSTMTLTHGVGDYDIDKQGRATRSPDQTGQYMWTSIRINAPHIFETAPNNSFSYLQLLDEAQNKGRLYAQIHQGNWHHISTPEDLETVNNALKKSQTSA